MKLYHGSLEVVKHPIILQPNRKLDYGEGFYTTTSEEQAKDWVKRRMLEKQFNYGYVNIYEFDEAKLSGLKSLIFAAPDVEWVKFVMANRTEKGFTHSYDIVYGPVANDKVYLQFGLYESEVISVEPFLTVFPKPITR